MQGKNKVLFRNLDKVLQLLIEKRQSALIFGPRQVGKTTLVKKSINSISNPFLCFLQDPSIRIDYEKDPGLLIRQIKALKSHPIVFIDEAQKVPEIFDSVQYLIDEGVASFIITGSSARKLRRKGANFLPGRVKNLRLSPLLFNEMGLIKNSNLSFLKMENINSLYGYSLEKIMIFGSLPAITIIEDDKEREDFLKAYSYSYLEEEIRAEALVRKIGAFSRFLELAALESGTAPNFSKLSMESKVSAPAIKEFYNILEDTLIIERVDPYIKNPRRRIFSSPKYYFFDIGVRNSIARIPLIQESINLQKGLLFEHVIMLEIINRIRTLGLNYKVYYWRTSSGLEVDCVIDTGEELIPIEIKSSSKVDKRDAYAISVFLNDYFPKSKRGFIITMAEKPEVISKNITAIPWNWF